MKTIGIIPVRMASSRFPGKPMVKIHGMPMVGHCYYRTCLAHGIDTAFVATCDEEISDYARTIGATCIMTSKSHERASDRIAEAMLKLEKETGVLHKVVVLVQGDEPMLHPEMIDIAVTALEENPKIMVANGIAEIKTTVEFDDVNEIKVVVDRQMNAIYFSREPIPSRAKWDGVVPMWKQVCIIPFRRDYLLEFNETPQTPLEKVESIDMLRVIENGGMVRMVKMHHQTLSVDTPEDLNKVRKLMRNDTLIACYGH